MYRKSRYEKSATSLRHWPKMCSHASVEWSHSRKGCSVEPVWSLDDHKRYESVDEDSDDVECLA